MIMIQAASNKKIDVEKKNMNLSKRNKLDRGKWRRTHSSSLERCKSIYKSSESKTPLMDKAIKFIILFSGNFSLKLK